MQTYTTASHRLIQGYGFKWNCYSESTSLLKWTEVSISDKIDMINKVIIYCKRIPLPAIDLSKVMDFNGTVTMNLHQLWEKLWYSHFINEYFTI